MTKKQNPKQLDGVDALTAYLYADTLRRGDIKTLRDEVIRLTKLTEWQPIETAPKDGTEVFLWNGTNINSNCAWFDEYNEDKHCYGFSNPKEFKSGWYFFSGYYYYFCNNYKPFTHWFKLPRPPKK